MHGKYVLMYGKHVLMYGKHVLMYGKHVLMYGTHVLIATCSTYGKHALDVVIYPWNTDTFNSAGRYINTCTIISHIAQKQTEEYIKPCNQKLGMFVVIKK